MTGERVVRDALGRSVPVPDGTDAGLWERFCQRVVMLPAPGCHLWTGPPRDDGYGQVRVRAGALVAGVPAAVSGPVRAHRFAYAAITGQTLTEEEHLLHVCDQPLCCRITLDGLAAHQELGDNAANMADKQAKGRNVLPNRWGLPQPTRAARRAQTERSLAIHRVLVEELGLDELGRVTRPDADPARIAAAVAALRTVGRTNPAWPMLPLEDLQ
jgi:hypothetical protein